MKNGLKLSISLVLVFLMIFNISMPVFAKGENSNPALERIKELPTNEKQLLQNAIDKPGFTNVSELSASNRNVVNKFTKNPQLYLADAAVVNNQVVLLYNTSDLNVMIASTNGHVEVVEKKNENTFIINGKTHKIKNIYEEEAVRASEEPITASSNSWVEGSNPGGTWYVSSTSWHDLHFENTIGTYTVGALATIISFFVYPVAGVVIGVASLLLGSAYTNTSVAKVYKTAYKHKYPIYKRDHFRAYAVYQGNNIFLGTENKYYHRTPGV
ncbi:hypothetical protein [Metabacillus arenae]|uniref:Uncharacterized protein n=1 Tax=Metabacillus arenae TaxID=2771434 RepID=A0A926NLK0_9BACI|nr:hypothetical protein [Metabacillus arenae]MBD1383621.1 hypothetical protein [Metabacillus arenae]